MIENNKIEFLTNYITDKITTYIISDYNLNLPNALNVIYNSRTFENLKNSETSLYIQSPSYIYELLKKECATILHRDC